MTPDGRRVVSASHDNTLKVWDLESGRAVATLDGHAAWVTACAVTPDGRRVVSASDDNTLKVWDLETGRAVSTLDGHAARVLACAVTPDGRSVVSASDDHTLKVWDLESGRAVATLDGHAAGVLACAVTPDGRRVVSASADNTLKVWDLESGACFATHRANVGYSAIATTANVIVAGDASGAVWFLDWPSSSSPDEPLRVGPSPEPQPRSHSDNAPLLPPRSPMQKHTILFLAANPSGVARLALDEEARAIQEELERSGFRDRFEFVTQWAVRPLDLLRQLRKLKPTVVHFSGHGGPDTAAEHRPAPAPSPRRDVVASAAHGHCDERQYGLFFQGSDGRPQFISAHAIEETFGAAGSSVRLVILNACYSDIQADALLAHVDCVVGMNGAIHDDAARSFAIGFYGGLGEHESVAAAYKQGRAALSLLGQLDSARPQLKARAGVDASQLVLAVDPPESRSPQAPR